MRLLLLALVSAATLLLSSCIGLLGPQQRVPKLDGARNVLFIGNSHTYANDLPGLVEWMAHQLGDTELRTAEVAEPNFALEDHWALGIAQSALQQSAWTWVVMQQGTSALPESQVHLEHWTNQFAPLVRAAGAEPVLYQIWPIYSRRFDADAALTSYWNAAHSVNGILAPVGDAFTVGMELEPQVVLYAGDGLHASPYGTYVAAAIITARLLDIDPLTLPPTIPHQSTDSVTVRQLQAIAVTALGRSPARPTARRTPHGGLPK